MATSRWRANGVGAERAHRALGRGGLLAAHRGAQEGAVRPVTRLEHERDGGAAAAAAEALDVWLARKSRRGYQIRAAGRPN